jgi:hypothetical protein
MLCRTCTHAVPHVHTCCAVWLAATRGVSKGLLMIKYAADKQQGELSILLKQGENPNVKAKVEWQQFETTPLFEGAVNGYTRIVRLLIEYGANPISASHLISSHLLISSLLIPSHLIPSHPIPSHPISSQVRLLIEYGAKVDEAVGPGFTPLYVRRNAPSHYRLCCRVRPRARVAAERACCCRRPLRPSM